MSSYQDIRTLPGFTTAMTADERVALMAAHRPDHPCTDADHTGLRHYRGMCEDYSATLPDYVRVDCQGFWANVLVPAGEGTLMVLMVLPPRVWLKERTRAIAMIRAELRACGIAA